MDYPDDTTDEAQAAADAVIAAEAPTVAPYWSGPDPCEAWPYPPTGTRGPIAADGAAPIVVVGTTNDPATPYEWSVALADQLASGVLITRVGEGHTGLQQGQRVRRRAPWRRICCRERFPRTDCAASSAPLRRVRGCPDDPVRSMIVHRASAARHLSSVGRAIHS